MADTNLTIKQIEVALYNSPIIVKDLRNDIVITNLSWGMLNHEADFVVVNKSGYITEVEIKRSFADFKADFEKKVFHKDERVSCFYYCVPLSIVDKGKAFLKTKPDKIKELCGYTFGFPALLTYDEFGSISCDKEYSSSHIGGRRLFLEEKFTICRLISLRYWNLRKKNDDLNHKNQLNLF